MGQVRGFVCAPNGAGAARKRRGAVAIDGQACLVPYVNELGGFSQIPASCLLQTLEVALRYRTKLFKRLFLALDSYLLIGLKHSPRSGYLSTRVSFNSAKCFDIPPPPPSCLPDCLLPPLPDERLLMTSSWVLVVAD